MKPIVIKLGGSLLNPIPDDLCENIASFIRDTDMQPIIIHGGGPHVSTMLEKLDIPTAFQDGLRVTDESALHVAEMVLSGSLNKQLVRHLQKYHVPSLGISGVDGKMISVEPMKEDGSLGYVGKVVHVDTSLVSSLLEAAWVPVISPLGTDEDHEAYNINADTAAGAVAQALHAPLIYVTNVDGVVESTENGAIHHPHLTDRATRNLIENGVISGGMIPKVEAALESVSQGVEEVVILNGLNARSLTEYHLSSTIGTRFTKEEKLNYA